MTVRFDLQAAADAQCLPRLLDFFAQRGLIPSAVTAHEIEQGLAVTIEHPTMDYHVASLICERMRRITSVERVTVLRAG